MACMLSWLVAFYNIQQHYFFAATAKSPLTQSHQGVAYLVSPGLYEQNNHLNLKKILQCVFSSESFRKMDHDYNFQWRSIRR